MNFSLDTKAGIYNMICLALVMLGAVAFSLSRPNAASFMACLLYLLAGIGRGMAYSKETGGGGE